MKERIPNPTDVGQQVTPGMLVSTALKDLKLRADAIGGSGGYIPYGFAAVHIRTAASAYEVIRNAFLESGVGQNARNWQRRALYGVDDKTWNEAMESAKAIPPARPEETP